MAINTNSWRQRLSTLAATLIVCTLATAQTALPQLRISFPDKVVRDMDYSNGQMELTDVDGSVVRLPAQFKTRGATAQSYLMKPSLNMKIRTDDYLESVDTTLLGIRQCSKYILDAMAIDVICMRNRVAMDIWNDFSPLPYSTDFAGRNGTVGQFVELWLNDEYKGIYCMSDQITRKLLNLKKYDEKKGLVRGVLYKSGTEDILDQNKVNHTDDFLAYTIAWHNAWELKEPDDYACQEAWQPLIDIYDMPEAYKWHADELYTEVKRYFYLDNIVDFQIFHMALCISDNWGNKNHFFSIRNIQKDINDEDPSEAARRKFVITPWDLDTSFGGSYRGTLSGGTYYDWPPSAMASNGGFFPLSACQDRTEYFDLMRQRWLETRANIFSSDSINARLNAYRDLFVQSGAWQRNYEAFSKTSGGPLATEDLVAEIDYIEQWYKQQHELMDEYFHVVDGIALSSAAASTDPAIYSLQGTRLPAAPKRGVYIQGKRVYVK